MLLFMYSLADFGRAFLLPEPYQIKKQTNWFAFTGGFQRRLVLTLKLFIFLQQHLYYSAPFR
jgi:hypothetical protein